MGLRIRFYRKEKKFSQEKLAELCKLHPSYIGQIERGEKNITVEILHRLALGLGVSMAELLQDIDGKESPEDNVLLEIYNQMFQISNGDLKRMKRLLDAILDIMNH